VPTRIDAPVLLVGPPDANHLALRPLRRSHPDSEDFWEGNWLKVDVSVLAGAFRGTFEADLRCDEFEQLLEQLSALQGAAQGAAALESAEGWVSLRLTLDPRGRLVGTCEVRDDPALGSSLRFELAADQAGRPAMLDALAGILRAFPVVGHPGDEPEDLLEPEGEPDAPDDA